MPYIHGDISFRYHFEKNNTKWIKTNSQNNIKKIISLTESQVYNHQQQNIPFNGYQKKESPTELLKNPIYQKLMNTHNSFTLIFILFYLSHLFNTTELHSKSFIHFHFYTFIKNTFFKKV